VSLELEISHLLYAFDSDDVLCSRHPHQAGLRLQRRRLLPDRRLQGQPHQPRAQLPGHPPLSVSPANSFCQDTRSLLFWLENFNKASALSNSSLRACLSSVVVFSILGGWL
jgi:hypothetical protein